MQDKNSISKPQYLIIGSSHAGLAALEAIRLQDETGAITMVTREDTLPYSPTILPYVISGEMDAEAIHLRSQSYFDQLSVTFKSGSAVTGLNLDENGLSSLREKKSVTKNSCWPPVPMQPSLRLPVSTACPIRLCAPLKMH